MGSLCINFLKGLIKGSVKADKNLLKGCLKSNTQESSALIIIIHIIISKNLAAPSIIPIATTGFKNNLSFFIGFILHPDRTESTGRSLILPEYCRIYLRYLAPIRKLPWKSFV